ncbi:MAG: hypothetical protein KBC84_04855 [Proteobacteria bacterium]|nr:hypothetical protein [Pseudomonadota bacterium]
MIKILITFLFIIVGIFSYLSFNKKEAVEISKSISNQVNEASKNSNLNNTQKELITIQLAVNDFMSTNGKPPEKLSDLVPKYFPAVPNDPATGKPYEYSVVDNKPVFAGLITNVDNTKAKEQANTNTASLKDGEFINPNTIVSELQPYDPKGKRDPFKPYVYSATPAPQKGGLLSNYSLGQLRLAAVATSPTGEKRALLEDDQGKGFTVGVGAIVGKESGVVKIIEDDKITIETKKIDFTGKEIINTIEIKANLRGSATQLKNDPKKKK